MTDLASSAELARKASKPYPGDSDEYRQARTALLQAEIDLRRQIGRVAELRRALPPGGEVSAGYRFLDKNGKEHGLADLFGRHNTLISYFWMYGPARERPCPMCTTFLDALDAANRSLNQRVAVAVIGRSPVSRQLAFAIERGWRFLEFFQCVGDEFPTAYRGLHKNDEEWPQLDVWTRHGEIVRHFWGASEMDGTADPGQDARNAPDHEALWTMLDLTPGGRGTDWYPKLDYNR
jgi:predicted dithiol-disulfide oxidoreductase (DUF899 family)